MSEELSNKLCESINLRLSEKDINRIKHFISESGQDFTTTWVIRFALRFFFKLYQAHGLVWLLTQMVDED
jgi:hypothetical protein